MYFTKIYTIITSECPCCLVYIRNQGTKIKLYFLFCQEVCSRKFYCVCLIFQLAATVYIVLCVYVTSIIPSGFTLMAMFKCLHRQLYSYNSPLQTDRSQKCNIQAYSGITAESAARRGGSSCTGKQEQGRNEEKNIRKLSVVCKI